MIETLIRLANQTNTPTEEKLEQSKKNGSRFVRDRRESNSNSFRLDDDEDENDEPIQVNSVRIPTNKELEEEEAQNRVSFKGASLAAAPSPPTTRFHKSGNSKRSDIAASGKRNRRRTIDPIPPPVPDDLEDHRAPIVAASPSTIVINHTSQRSVQQSSSKRSSPRRGASRVVIIRAEEMNGDEPPPPPPPPMDDEDNDDDVDNVDGGGVACSIPDSIHNSRRAVEDEESGRSTAFHLASHERGTTSLAKNSPAHVMFHAPDRDESSKAQAKLFSNRQSFYWLVHF